MPETPFPIHYYLKRCENIECKNNQDYFCYWGNEHTGHQCSGYELRKKDGKFDPNDPTNGTCEDDCAKYGTRGQGCSGYRFAGCFVSKTQSSLSNKAEGEEK